MTDPALENQIELGYRKLVVAIIFRAVVDYQRSLCECRHERNSHYGVTDCESFFKGDWFAQLTNLDGPYLMKSIKEECEKCGYDYRKLDTGKYIIT